MSEKLKPCPFCGGKRAVTVVDDETEERFGVKCFDCGGCIYPEKMTLEKAIEAWNRRAEPEIIRCGQCKYAEVADPEDNQDGYTCQYHRGSIWFSGSYCSWAERRTDE